MIKIIPLETEVTDLTHNEIVEKFGEVYGFKTKEGRTIAQIGFVQVEEKMEEADKEFSKVWQEMSTVYRLDHHHQINRESYKLWFKKGYEKGKGR